MSAEVAAMILTFLALASIVLALYGIMKAHEAEAEAALQQARAERAEAELRALSEEY